MSGYIINDDDIARVVRYLKTRRPERANREYAIQLLEVLHNAAKRVASVDPELINELEDLLGLGYTKLNDRESTGSHD